MAEQKFDLEWQGFWRDQDRGSVPAASGVYAVHTCTFNATANTVSINKLVYIGESVNVRGRVSNHELEAEWKKHLTVGEQLAFSFAPVSGTDRQRVEAALIFHHKPIGNTEYTKAFPFDTTHVNSKGQTGKIESYLVARRTP